MNRRSLLTATVASVMLPGAVKAEGRGHVQGSDKTPDAALIAACNEYLSINQAWSTYCSTRCDIELGDPGLTMLEPLAALVEQIVVLRATTAEGHLARARCKAFYWLPEADVCKDDPAGAAEDRFEAAELRDLIAMEREAAIPGVVPQAIRTAHPDAELLTACAALDRLERAYLATYVRGVDDGPEWDAAEAERDRLADAQEPLAERICELRALTERGKLPALAASLCGMRS